MKTIAKTLIVVLSFSLAAAVQQQTLNFLRRRREDYQSLSPRWFPRTLR